MITQALLLFAILFLLMMNGAPMGIALGLSTAITLLTTSPLGPTTIATACFSGLDSFPLLAIPFFILAGNLMKFGGCPRRSCCSPTRWWARSRAPWAWSPWWAVCSSPPCPAPARPPSAPSAPSPSLRWRRRAMTRPTAPPLTAAAGTIGVIIPPSIPFVIYGVTANCSIADMFKAGVLPGILIGAALMIVNGVTCRKYGWDCEKTEKFSFRKVLTTLRDTWLALMVPVIILGGHLRQYLHPHRVRRGGHCLHSAHRQVRVPRADLKTISRPSVRPFWSTAKTNFLVGFSMAFARFLTMAQIPGSIAESIALIDNKILVLLLINLFTADRGLLHRQHLLHADPDPIFLPIVESYGMDPIQFGIMMTVNLCIGFVTPPYGCNLFIASAISNVPILSIAKRIIR